MCVFQMAGASKRSEDLQIVSAQPNEHYKEKGYVKIGRAQVKIVRERFKKDYVYQYVVKDEVPVTFNERALEKEFVIKMRKYISRYGAPKLSRVLFFGRQAWERTSEQFFDDHDAIIPERSDNGERKWPSRDVPRFAFNWQGRESLTWFTRLGSGSKPVFEVIAQRSSPAPQPTPEAKFNVGDEVVFHTIVDKYVDDPRGKRKVVEQVSWDECVNDKKKWYSIANKSTLRDTDWLYRVEGVKGLFREEDLANYLDTTKSTEFLESVNYRTLAWQGGGGGELDVGEHNLKYKLRF